MKNKLKTAGIIFSIMVITIASGNYAFAQKEKPHHPPRLPDAAQIEKMVDELSKELSLSESKKKKIAELHYAHFAKVKELMEKHREPMENMRKDFEKQVNEQLTEKQQKMLKEFMKRKRPPHEGKHEKQH